MTIPSYVSESHITDNKTLSTNVSAGLLASAMFVVVQNYNDNTEPSAVRQETGGDRSFSKVGWQSGGYQAVWMGLLLVPEAATKNVVVTGATPKLLTCITVQYVNQSISVGTFVSAYESSSSYGGDAIPSTATDLILSACGFGANQSFSAYNCTLRASYGWVPNNGVFGVGTHVGVSPSVSSSYQVDTASYTAHCGVAIKEYIPANQQIIMF